MEGVVLPIERDRLDEMAVSSGTAAELREAACEYDNDPPQIASGFSMIEPLEGGGSDPKMIRTTAEKHGDEWGIDGHK